jgi:hypothetical protein
VPRLHYSFVVDSIGPFAYQGYLLARSLIECGGVHPTAITANLIKGTLPAIDDSFRALGIHTRCIQPFPGHPHCNKIQQLEHLATADADAVVLLDADTCVMAPLPLDGMHEVLGKIVDSPNPPLEVLEAIYANARICLETTETDIIPGTTARNNFNGGLYVIPTAATSCLHQAWRHWARWCISNVGIFRTWSRHIDQVSFALSVADLRLSSKSLPRTLNFPTHLGGVSAEAPPAVLHYHRHMDDERLLLPTGNPIVDAVVAEANSSIRRWRSPELPREFFDSFDLSADVPTHRRRMERSTI